MKYDCEKTTKDKHLEKDVNIDPRIVVIQNELNGFDERIQTLDNVLQLMSYVRILTTNTSINQ